MDQLVQEISIFLPVANKKGFTPAPQHELSFKEKKIIFIKCYDFTFY